MIGVYDYTVVLTYLSMISGVVGITLTMVGVGHPYIGAIFLMVSGLLDAFDGRVARTKKNRTDIEKKFGTQIDSLSDLICFGILPAAIGVSQLRHSGLFLELAKSKTEGGKIWILVILMTIAVGYVLTALIRLAYFNATEEERKKEAEVTGFECFTGVPVTTAALVFPLTLIIHYYTKWDLTVFYFFLLLIVSFSFVWNIKIKKPGKKGLIIMMILGSIELFYAITIIYEEGYVHFK